MKVKESTGILVTLLRRRCCTCSCRSSNKDGNKLRSVWQSYDGFTLFSDVNEDGDQKCAKGEVKLASTLWLRSNGIQLQANKLLLNLQKPDHGPVWHLPVENLQVTVLRLRTYYGVILYDIVACSAWFWRWLLYRTVLAYDWSWRRGLNTDVYASVWYAISWCAAVIRRQRGYGQENTNNGRGVHHEKRQVLSTAYDLGMNSKRWLRRRIFDYGVSCILRRVMIKLLERVDTELKYDASLYPHTATMRSEAPKYQAPFGDSGMLL